MTLRRKTNFRSPGVLQPATPFLGSTVGTWNSALTGGMQKTLMEEKLRQQKDVADLQDVATPDMASGEQE